jgi:hypothetical protein
MVSKLPEGAVLHGSSNRTHNEIWTLSDRVLCMQSSPERNIFLIKELIINKLYDVGKLDDNQKSKDIEQLNDEMKPLSSHFMIKIINNFLKMPNSHMIKHFNELKKVEIDKFNQNKNIKTEVGKSILPKNAISPKNLEKLDHPPTLMAKSNRRSKNGTKNSHPNLKSQSD